MSTQKPVSCGLDFCAVPGLKECLYLATSSRYEFIVVPFVHPKFKREFVNDEIHKSGPFTRSDMILCSTDWNTLVVGKLSPHINVDTGNWISRKNNEEMLRQELDLATHLSLVAITFKLKGNIQNNANFARIIYDKLMSPCGFQVWVQVPMENPLKQARTFRQDNFQDEPESTWEWWNSFRAICDCDRRLGVALIISHDIPDEEEIKRWLGEPITCLIFPTTIFITNKKGYPVLSRAHQMLVKRFCALDVQFVLSGSNRYQSITHYYHYLDYLWKNWQMNGPINHHARGYEDYLQCPLQPLMDNLESGTYEVFEKDPVKYSQYQGAIYKAILEMATNKNRGKPDIPIVIMVVGAGRGPLVSASLNAAQNANKKVKVYAVEKNPNAILTLQALQQELWQNDVTIVASDMRKWQAPEKADIIVSELLGSFGDNELSPECLDGVMQFLKDDGICIPCEYSSYIAPIQSSKLYNEVRRCKETNKHPLAHFEAPYVVHLQNKYDIDQPQQLFTFKHPNRESHDNSRYEVKKFQVKQNAILHGFSGYFDAVLFNDIMISILPSTYSTGMISWFPIFFPIKDPVHVKAGDEIVVHFWRVCRPKSVWYEWSISKPVTIAVHNPNGRTSTIGL